jgi:hypothetical protein
VKPSILTHGDEAPLMITSSKRPVIDTRADNDYPKEGAAPLSPWEVVFSFTLGSEHPHRNHNRRMGFIQGRFVAEALKPGR